MNKTYFDAKNKVWSGRKVTSIYNSNANLGYLILKVLQNTPNLITQVSADNGNEMTCHEMYQRSIKIASYLTSYEAGDVAGFMARNSENLAPLAFACLTLGLPINPLDHSMQESDIEFMFGLTRPKVIFADADVIKKIETVITKIQLECKFFTVDKKLDGYEFIGDVVDRDYNIDDFV